MEHQDHELPSPRMVAKNQQTSQNKKAKTVPVPA
jgi:hypothetical protein